MHPPLFTVFLAPALMLPTPSHAEKLDDYLTGFTYQERKDMKIESKELVDLLKKSEAQFIDIHFPEEFAAWRMEFAKNIPLNELPSRLNELQKQAHRHRLPPL